MGGGVGGGRGGVFFSKIKKKSHFMFSKLFPKFFRKENNSSRGRGGGVGKKKDYVMFSKGFMLYPSFLEKRICFGGGGGGGVNKAK